MTRLFIVFICLMVALKADVKSTTGQIRFDAQSDNQTEMLLNGTGLGIGVAPSTNLHVNGNAIVSGRIFAGGSSGSSNLNVNGTLGFGYQTVSSNATLGASSLVLVDSSSDNITITLPYASNVTGRLYQIKKISTFNSVWINGGGNLIDDTNVIELPDSSDLGSVKLMSNGSQWYKMGQKDILETIAADNLIAWWKLDESSGNIAYDSSTSNKHGYLQDGSANFTFSTNQVDGAVGKALYFDGDNDFINLPTPVSFTNGDQWTISFWAVTMGASNESLAFGDASTNENFVYLKGGDYFRYRSMGVSYDFTELTDFSVISQYTLTSNGTDVTLYKNGNYVAEKVANTEVLINAIGNGISSGVFYFDGIIDDLRVYDRLLTSSEIKSLYSREL